MLYPHMINKKSQQYIDKLNPKDQNHLYTSLKSKQISIRQNYCYQKINKDRFKKVATQVQFLGYDKDYCMIFGIYGSKIDRNNMDCLIFTLDRIIQQSFYSNKNNGLQKGYKKSSTEGISIIFFNSCLIKKKNKYLSLKQINDEIKIDDFRNEVIKKLGLRHLSKINNIYLMYPSLLTRSWNYLTSFGIQNGLYDNYYSYLDSLYQLLDNVGQLFEVNKIDLSILSYDISINSNKNWKQLYSQQQKVYCLNQFESYDKMCQLSCIDNEQEGKDYEYKIKLQEYMNDNRRKIPLILSYLMRYIVQKYIRFEGLFRKVANQRQLHRFQNFIFKLQQKFIILNNHINVKNNVNNNNFLNNNNVNNNNNDVNNRIDNNNKDVSNDVNNNNNKVNNITNNITNIQQDYIRQLNKEISHYQIQTITSFIKKLFISLKNPIFSYSTYSLITSSTIQSIQHYISTYQSNQFNHHINNQTHTINKYQPNHQHNPNNQIITQSLNINQFNHYQIKGKVSQKIAFFQNLSKQQHNLTHTHFYNQQTNNLNQTINPIAFKQNIIKQNKTKIMFKKIPNCKNIISISQIKHQTNNFLQFAQMKQTKPYQYYTLKEILTFLNKIKLNQKFNLMSSNNLAICFNPCFFKAPINLDKQIQQSVHDQCVKNSKLIKVLQRLISYPNLYFKTE